MKAPEEGLSVSPEWVWEDACSEKEMVWEIRCWSYLS